MRSGIYFKGYTPKLGAYYKTLFFFNGMYESMSEPERKEFLSEIIEKIEIYEEAQPSGQWLKSITFKLPIISHDKEIRLDKEDHIETVCLLSRKAPV